MSEDYSMVFEDATTCSSDEGMSDDNSDSAYLPNVLSPIQCKEEFEGGAGEALRDTIQSSTPKQEACNDVTSNDNDGTKYNHEDAGIVEAVDTLLKIHPLPTTSKKKRKEQQGRKEDDETIVDEWRNATDAKSGRTYYYNRRTRETRWKLPTNAIFVPRKEKTKESTSSQKVSSSLHLGAPESSGTDISSNKREGPQLQVQAQHEGERRIENGTEKICAQELPNQNDSTTPPRQVLWSPPEVRRIDASFSGLKDGVLFGPATTTASTSSSTSRSPFLSSNAMVTSTPAPGMASTPTGPTPINAYSRSLSSYPTSNERQNVDGHRIFCVYCASSCASINGLADHLLECQAYMSMLAKHPRSQRRLEDTMLRTWGIKREIPSPTVEDSFDARLISNSHISGLDSVATPSITEHLTPSNNHVTRNGTAGSASTSSIRYGDHTPPSVMNARPVTASTISSTDTDSFMSDQSFGRRHAGPRSRKEDKSLISHPPSLCSNRTSSSTGRSTTCMGQQHVEGGSSIHNYHHDEYGVGGNENFNDDDGSSSPLRDCAFCGRAVENLSRHLLRCKTRQRTQERRRKASAMAIASSSGHVLGSAAAAAAATTTSTIQRVMSGGRSLPGHPRTDKRIDHARRLDYY